MARTVHCIKLGKDLDGMDFPPYPGELGKKIYLNVSKEAWAAWLKQQTMLINHYGLNVMDPQARSFLKQNMQAFFFKAGAAEDVDTTKKGTIEW